MVHKIGLILLSFLIGFSVYAQDEKPDPYGRDLDALTLKKRGPNSDKYSHLYIGYGFVTGFDLDSSEITYGKSGVFTLGYLFKWRILKYMEGGFDFAYHRTAYHLKQDSSKTIPNTTLHDKEKIVFNSLEVSPFLRFKLRNRFRSNGTFIDIGAFTGWQYSTKHETVREDFLPGAGKSKTVNTDLEYKRKYVYGALARVGFNRVIFYGRYRMHSLFNEDSGFDDFPKYEVGIKLGIHQ